MKRATACWFTCVVALVFSSFFGVTAWWAFVAGLACARVVYLAMKIDEIDAELKKR